MHEVGIACRTLVEISHLCERGNVRTTNEDSIAIVDSREDSKPEKGILLVVADGLGGMDEGEVASQYVAMELPALYLGDSVREPEEALLSAVHEVNKNMYQMWGGFPAGKRKGSTVVAAIILENRICTVNVGDSRAYILHQHRLRQLTRDHTLGTTYFLPHSVGAHRFSHVLTQALGPNPTVSPFLATTQFSPGDILLLCSDGLTSVLTDSEIEHIITTQPFENCALALRNQVYEREGEDNISIILSRIVGLE